MKNELVLKLFEIFLDGIEVWFVKEYRCLDVIIFFSIVSFLSIYMLFKCLYYIFWNYYVF